MLTRMGDTKQGLNDRGAFVLFLVALFLLIKPESIHFVPIINNIINILSAVLSVIILLRYIIIGKTSKLQIAILLFVGTIFVSTILNSGDIIFFLKTYLPFVSVSMLAEMGLREKPKLFLKAITVLIFIYVTVNLATILAYYTPDPDYSRNIFETYFLGYDNSSVVITCVGCIIAMAYSEYVYKKQRFWIYILVGEILVSYIYVWAVSCIICTCILVWYLLVGHIKIIKKINNIGMSLLVQIIMFLALPIYNIQLLFEGFITDVLKKDPTITGRVQIWSNTKDYISSSLIIGHGAEEYDARMRNIGIYHAHNSILNIVMEGGIIAILAYINIYVTIMKSVRKSALSRTVQICSLGFLIYAICTAVDVIDNRATIYILAQIIWFFGDGNSRKVGERKKMEHNHA